MKNPAFDKLSVYPFWRLAKLLETEAKPSGMDEIALQIGEPKIPQPAFVAQIIAANAEKWGNYPPHPGTESYRAACANWLQRRYDLPDGMIDGERNVLPCAGTKEALFHMGLLAVPRDRPTGNQKPYAVLVPNPVYQVYYGAAVFSGGEPYPIAATAETNFMPDYAGLDPDILERTALCYLCNPANPQGACASLEYLTDLIKLARKHDFVLVFDECYSEIYRGAPPIGGLQACAELGGDLRNVVVLHSLSKRSSAPGLRCGFVAGDPELIDLYRTIRSYASVAVPLPLLAAGEALWNDEAHVDINRAHYADLFDMAESILGHLPAFTNPPGGFYLWLDVGDGEAAAVKLWREAAIRCMPGGYMAQDDPFTGENPAAKYLRVCLVHEKATAREALERISGVLGG
ncbi:MAG: aminotransferase class I/II-fold pyridoxal phosphate-dependent enzyme [Proteobacteria bacterium]|nr:aminotransferase class I/II-fold pyridoxal phosphate-dependent enzyme [Pseudomonadota bacterium]